MAPYCYRINLIVFPPEDLPEDEADAFVGSLFRTLRAPDGWEAFGTSVSHETVEDFNVWQGQVFDAQEAGFDL